MFSHPAAALPIVYLLSASHDQLKVPDPVSAVKAVSLTARRKYQYSFQIYGRASGTTISILLHYIIIPH